MLAEGAFGKSKFTPSALKSPLVGRKPITSPPASLVTWNGAVLRTLYGGPLCRMEIELSCQPPRTCLPNAPMPCGVPNSYKPANENRFRKSQSAGPLNRSSPCWEGVAKPGSRFTREPAWP